MPGNKIDIKIVANVNFNGNRNMFIARSNDNYRGMLLLHWLLKCK